MAFFLRLIMIKVRAVLLFRYAKNMESVLSDEFSPDDLAFIRTLASSQNKRINSHTLLEFLKASELIGNAVVETLPIELAIIRIVAEKLKPI